MLDKDLLLNNLLRLEVVKKGQTATFAFLGFALFSLIYGYGCQEFLAYIKIFSTFLIVVNSARFFLYRSILKKNSINQKEWIFTVILITLNGIGLGTVLGIASFELQLSGLHFAVVTTLLAGLVGSSIVTLSYFSILFIPFQTVLLVPQICIILYYHFSSDHYLNSLPLIVLYVMYYLYQLKQFSAYRKDLVKLFTYQLELEAKNQELVDSKNIIMDQSVKLVHTSRLAVLGEMSTGIAHEINNPLTVISGSVQVLSRLGRNKTLDLDQVVQYSQKIQKAVERISKIIKGLKHFATQSDRIPKERVSIQEIVDETKLFSTELFENLGIKLHLDSVPDVKIWCRAIQISQVLVNLLKNASDALENEERPDHRWVSLNFKSDGEFFYFIISNGGEKIPEEVSEKIFHPFFTTKEKEKGTGLGLSISHTIMKDHGGDLYCDNSNECIYTTFVIKHPLTQKDLL